MISPTIFFRHLTFAQIMMILKKTITVKQKQNKNSYAYFIIIFEKEHITATL